MGKKMYAIRLYHEHDLDLISLFATHNFHITKAVYCVLSAFVKKEHFVIAIPEKKEMYKVGGENNRVFKRRLTLDEEKDKDIIDMLSSIKSGFRNNFMKMLLRQYLAHPLAEIELYDPESYVYFKDRFNIIRSNRRVADAARPRHVKKSDANQLLSPKKNDNHLNTNDYIQSIQSNRQKSTSKDGDETLKASESQAVTEKQQDDIQKELSWNEQVQKAQEILKAEELRNKEKSESSAHVVDEIENKPRHGESIEESSALDTLFEGLLN